MDNCKVCGSIGSMSVVSQTDHLVWNLCNDCDALCKVGKDLETEVWYVEFEVGKDKDRFRPISVHGHAPNGDTTGLAQRGPYGESH